MSNTMMKRDFNSYAQWTIYGFKTFFSDFSPIVSQKANEASQREFHSILKSMIEILYNEPSILNMSNSDDYNTEQGRMGMDVDKETRDAITKLKLSASKILFGFFTFLYETGIHGVIENEKMTIQLKDYKASKVSVKPVYLELLRKVDIDSSKTKDDLVLSYKNPEIFNAWNLLSSVSYNKFIFALGIYNNSFDYLQRKVEQITGLEDGYLSECEEKLLQNGFEKKMRINLGNTELNFGFSYVKQSSGFGIGYTTRWNEIFFQSISHQGFKAMLENFNDFDDDIKAYLVKTERGCKNCRECAKPGKDIWAININYENKNISACPKWPDNNIDIRSIDFMIKFFNAQNEYANRK